MVILRQIKSLHSLFMIYLVYNSKQKKAYMTGKEELKIISEWLSIDEEYSPISLEDIEVLREFLSQIQFLQENTKFNFKCISDGLIWLTNASDSISTSFRSIDELVGFSTGISMQKDLMKVRPEKKEREETQNDIVPFKGKFVSLEGVQAIYKDKSLQNYLDDSGRFIEIGKRCLKLRTLSGTDILTRYNIKDFLRNV